MPMIIRNNIRYAGGSGESNSGENIVELTQAEYDALGDVVNSDNITYYITDSDEQLDASSVVFDDTETQLGASDVQVAISKLNSNIDEQNKNKANKIKRYDFYSLATDAYGEIDLGHIFNQGEIVLYATSNSGARLTVYSALGKFILKAVDQLNGAIVNTEIFGVSVYYMEFI